MSGCACTHRCRITASYGRKFVETMALPSAWATAHLMTSRADLSCNSTLALEIWSGVMQSVRGNGFLQEYAVTPVAKAFAGVAFFRKTREYGAEFILHVRVLNYILPNPVEACAGGVAPKPDLITARRFAYESNLRHVGPRTTIRAARGANDDFFAPEPKVTGNFFKPIDQTRQVTFRFRQRQSARWQSRTSHGGGVVK